MTDKTCHEPSEGIECVVSEIVEKDRDSCSYKGIPIEEDGQSVLIDAHSKARYFVQEILDVKTLAIKSKIHYL